ncbi:U7 snRNA-associated Sm-like protein LSm10 [Bicyclus anynana]|uniref:U7 snRNA-associated Sm-like protein LSm10 n=1 Tax=Bicyclus anynana TaxID=110368 RepID=A0A6J1NAV5_BICAN|nr:U7 snRNA-associated Sm-like protein LSm10 [Bicyclus anynana]
MNFEGTNREKFFYHNTLICLIRSLQGKNITVDLRNDSYVCGQLATVDGFMNLSFNKAVYCDTKQNEFSFDNLFVQARNIRYVHIPETMPILESIKNELKINKGKKPVQKPGFKSRKAAKALQQHMKTVAEL